VPECTLLLIIWKQCGANVSATGSGGAVMDSVTHSASGRHTAALRATASNVPRSGRCMSASREL
jgi:hypothetical protein